MPDVLRTGHPRPHELALLILPLLAGLALASGPEPGPDAAAPPAATTPVDAMVFETPPPPFSDPDIFPCSQCHNEDMPPNPERRELQDMHTEIVLHHDQEHRWCLDCHDAGDRDHLRLANGTLVGFAESYRLCGQCHGDKYRDWRAGVHGRRTGDWNGQKQYLLCVHCHDSHAPRFKPIAPMPAPTPPGRR
ncbi:MAG: hypothetical protein R6X35_14165 [Candidatus Krumholzibacteriia bacterium]